MKIPTKEEESIYDRDRPCRISAFAMDRAHKTVWQRRTFSLQRPDRRALRRGGGSATWPACVPQCAPGTTGALLAVPMAQREAKGKAAQAVTVKMVAYLTV